jgi:uncharacterized protein (DUF427 family)
MSLTTGRAPFSADPAGRFVPPLTAAGRSYVEPLLRRVRGLVGERVAVDSERVALVHRQGSPPAYAFPAQDVRDVESSPEPAIAGYVQVAWAAVDAWYEEEERIDGHPRNPYHRIDCIRARRRLRVELAGEVLVDTRDVIAVFESSRAPQLYAPPAAVRTDRLIPSATLTYCPYKGAASHWSARVNGELVPDVAWSYNEPTPESRPIAGFFSFYPERTRMLHDALTWFTLPAADGGEHACGSDG